MKSLRLCLPLCLLVYLQPVAAFYSWQSEQGQGEARGLVRAMGTVYDYPTTSTQKDRTVWAGLARVMVQGESSPTSAYEFNSYFIAIPDASLLSQGSGTVLDVERSSLLEQSYSKNDYLHLAVDRLNWHWRGERSEVILGRQPINLTTTFFFTPNDFFAPFSAQAFYRVYKAGVDGVRLEYRLGDLSQLSLMSVAGYQRDSSTASGWAAVPDNARRSDLLRATTVWRDWEWGVIAGSVSGDRVVGASIQGDLLAGIGLRSEGHLRWQGSDATLEWSLGLERRWENSLTIQFEHFLHGAGASSVNGYAALVGKTAYLAQRYSALGASYQLSPLWNGQVIYLLNHTDQSAVLSLSTVYSLADEAELAFGLSMAQGEPPQGSTLYSEFGAYPLTANLEYRHFF